MNVNFKSGLFINYSAPATSNNLTDKLTNGHVQVVTTTIDQQNHLQEAKQLLTNSLEKSSAQQLNKYHQGAQDRRLQLYIGNKDVEPYEVFSDRVTQHINTGKSRGESSEELNSLLQRISQGAQQAHTETRSILSGLGKLDADTESYIAQSSTYTRFALNELESKISETEAHQEITDNNKAFSLLVTTREGDEININIQQTDGWHDKTYGNKVSVSYEVEGDLSESEKIALSDLMNAIGSSSDSLLAGNDFSKVMGVENFNGQQLSGFSLSLNGSGQDINYTYQLNDNSQTLTGNWAQNGVVTAQFNLKSQLGGNADDEQLAQYLDLLHDAAESSYKNNDDKDQSDQTSPLFSNAFTDFMQLAEDLGNSLDSVDQQFTQARKLANDLFDKTIENQETRLGLKDEQQATLKEGFNQLADFSANFVDHKGGFAKQGKNANIKKLATGYDVQMSQKTVQKQKLIDKDLITGLKQSQSVKFDGVMNAIKNERSHQFSEGYEIMSAFDEKQNFKGYKQTRSVSEQSKEKIYVGAGISPFSKIDKNSVSKNDLYILKEGVSETSSREGFENIIKGAKAGDYALSENQYNKNLHYEQSQFTPSEASFQNNLQTQLSIASQKQLLDDLFNKL